jgi:hypothetical protein
LSRHSRMIDRAYGVALTSQHRWKLGALLVNGNRILEASPNKFRCSPEIDPNNASWHAEASVLRRRFVLSLLAA